MSSHGRLNKVSTLLGCAGLLLASSAYAQSNQPGSTPGQPSKTKVVRRPIVDLKKQAEEPRPGQVLPGQPQPTPPQPAAPQPAAPQPETPVEAQPAHPDPVPVAALPAEATARQPAATPPAPSPQPMPTPAAPQPVPQPTQPSAPPAAPAAAALPQEQPRPVDLPETAAPAQTATPAARVTKPLKPAPIPVSAGAPAEPSGTAPAVSAASAASTPSEPPVAAAPVVVTSSNSAVVVEQPPPPPPIEAIEPLPDTAPPPTRRAVVEPDVSRSAAESRASAPMVAEPAAAAEPSLPTGEPVHAKVTGIDGPTDVIQWRVDDGEWMNLVVNDAAKGVIEVRTGLGAGVSFILADQVSVKVSRLSRVRLEQRTPQQPGLPVELVVDISRGEVDIKPLPMTPGSPAPAVVRIVTPDKNFTTRLATGVRFDAFTGTRLRTVTGE